MSSIPVKTEFELDLKMDVGALTDNTSATLNASNGSSGGNIASSSNSNGSTDFVKKLYKMLQQDEYKDVVRWTKDGDSFVVLDTNQFTKNILPNHFKHSNFASFVRQLNKYDFHKVKISSNNKQSKEFSDGAWEFIHPEFKKNNKDALDNIKRKGPTQKKAAGEQSSEAIGNLNKKIFTLQSDYNSLKDEMKSMKAKYNIVLDSLMTFRNTNTQYQNALTTLINCVSNAGIKVPLLDLPPISNNDSEQDEILDSTKNDIGVKADTSTKTNKKTNKNAKNPKANIKSATGIGRTKQPALDSPENIVAPVAAPTSSTSTPIYQGNEGSNMLPAGQDLPPPFQGSFHVLLVEDDAVCIQLCRKFLLKYGCTVEIVTDGLSAISVVNKTKYDLVLMDIVMPNLDGASATSVIRNFDSTTPIIAMTGNINDDDLMAYLRHGMSDILAKPFTKDDLYLILEKHLKKRIPVARQNSSSSVPQDGSQLQVIQEQQRSNSQPQLNVQATQTQTSSQLAPIQQTQQSPSSPGEMMQQTQLTNNSQITSLTADNINELNRQLNSTENTIPALMQNTVQQQQRQHSLTPQTTPGLTPPQQQGQQLSMPQPPQQTTQSQQQTAGSQKTQQITMPQPPHSQHPPLNAGMNLPNPLSLPLVNTNPINVPTLVTSNLLSGQPTQMSNGTQMGFMHDGSMPMSNISDLMDGGPMSKKPRLT